MKKILATAIAAIALATAAELVPVELRDGVASVPAGKVAAIAACSTNLTGIAALPGDLFLVSGLKGRAMLVIEQ